MISMSSRDASSGSGIPVPSLAELCEPPQWFKTYEQLHGAHQAWDTELQQSSKRGVGNREKRVLEKKLSDAREVLGKLDAALSKQQDNPIKWKIGEGELERRRGLLSSLRNVNDKLEHDINNVGGRGVRRVPLGAESEETAQLSNQQLYANQKSDLADQDEKLDGILDGVSRLKVMSQDINSELDLHASLLTELDGAVDATDARLQRNTKRIELVSESAGGWCGLLIMFLLFILIILLLATNWFCHIFKPSKC